MDITLCGPSLVAPYVEHMLRLAASSGRDGDVLSRARSADDPPDPIALAARLSAAWAKDLDTPEWERAFALVDGERVVGHADLRGGRVPGELHRATLGLGIDRGWRRAGWGIRLMETIHAWAREQGLAWIDLGVFGDNAPARALYTRLGYVEVGCTPDRFRIDGQSVTDLSMTLRL